jgi:hypothetical protein
MRYAALTAALLLLPTWGAAQEPTRPTSIDQLAAEVLGIRAKRAELDKAEAEKLAAIAAELKRLRELLEKLGLDAPKPVPPKPPEPVDPFKARLRAAFDGDPAALDARKSHALDLAALYRQMVPLCADRSVATSGDLLSRKKAAAASLIGTDALKGVRAAVGAELGAIMPTDAPLSDEQRTAAAALFGKLAVALEDIAR